MGSELPLKKSFGLFPRLKLYTGDPEGVRVSDNPWDRFRYLANLKPKPSRFKVGDFVKVIKEGHELFDMEVRVAYASGDLVEVTKGARTYNLRSEDLKWIRHSSV